MTKKTRKGELRSKNPKNILGEPAPGSPWEACAFGARLGNWSVFILAPRLNCVIYITLMGESEIESYAIELGARDDRIRGL